MLGHALRPKNGNCLPRILLLGDGMINFDDTAREITVVCGVYAIRRDKHVVDHGLVEPKLFFGAQAEVLPGTMCDSIRANLPCGYKSRIRTLKSFLITLEVPCFEIGDVVLEARHCASSIAL